MKERRIDSSALDADLSYSASEVSEDRQGPVLDGNADMCVAGFNKKAGDGGFGIVRRLRPWNCHVDRMKFIWPLSGQRASWNGDCLEKVAPLAE